MKKTTIALMAGLFAFNSLASVLDVKPIGIKKGAPYIRVTKLENQKVTFEKCLRGFEKSTCEGLGRKPSYTIKELQSQRRIENNEAGYALLADAGLLLVGGGIWFCGVAAVLSATVGSTALGIVGVSSVTGAAVGAGYLVSTMDALNPSEQARQWQAIDEDVINDNDVEVARNEMNDFIQRIDMVLSKIK